MKTSKLLSIIVFLGLLVSLTFSCKKDSPVTPDPIIDTKTKVIVIDTAVVSKKLDDISADGTLKFTGMSTEETPKKGDIICSAPATNAPLGFLYKVKYVTKAGNITTITTDLASVEEAVEDVDISKTINLTDYVLSVSNEKGELIPLSQVITKSDISSGLKFVVDKTVKFNNNVSCKIEGSVETSISFLFDLSIKKWDLKWLALSVQPQFKSTLTAAVEGTIKDSVTVNIAKIKLTPIVFWAGIIPVVVNPEISIDFLITAEAKIELVAKIVDIDLKYTAGVKYEGGQFSLINQNNSEPITILKDAELSLSGKLKVGPQLSCNFKIYNQEAYAGIYSEFYTKLITDEIKLDAQIAYGLELFNPKIKLVTGISLGPQAKLQVFSKKIAEWKPTVNVVSWTLWERALFPVFSIITFENPTRSSVTAKCEIEKLAGYLFQTIQHGFCWGQGEYPTIDIDGKNQLGVINNLNTFGKQSMSAEISGLKANTSYTIRPYFTSWLGTFYAEGKKYTTLNATIPIVVTTSVTNMTSTTATVGGNVTADGGSTVTERGVYWGTNPLVNGTKLQIGSNTGVFSTSLTGLTANTTYYIKAYAINSQGTAYGTQVSFTTGQNFSLATVTTAAATNITASGATLGGNVTADGNATVTEKGVYYSTEKDPKTTGTKVSVGKSGTGAFTVDVNTLSPNKTYYVQAYAINSQGTAYGNQINFTTGVIPSTAFTATPTSITAGQSVQFTDQSTNSPTSWSWNFGDGTTSTIQNPVHTYIAQGSYTISLTSTNNFGSDTSVKNNYITVNLAGNPPTPAFTATPTTITVGQSVQFTDQSTNTPTSWLWQFGDGATSTSQNPSHTYTSAGSYTVILTATNSYGYDSERKINYITVHTASGGILFNPNLTYGSVSDIDGNHYRTIQIGTQLWMAENLKTTKYKDGTAIPYVTDFAIWKDLETPGYCWLNNQTTNKDIYGALYNWYTVNTAKLCPEGWHVSTYDEWEVLTMFLGGYDIAGGKLKEAGTTHWREPYNGKPSTATNSSGFTGLPGQGRGYQSDYNGGFAIVLHIYGLWWTSNEVDGSNSAKIRELYFDAIYTSRGEINKKVGYSVRCVKD